MAKFFSFPVGLEERACHKNGRLSGPLLLHKFISGPHFCQAQKLRKFFSDVSGLGFYVKIPTVF